MIFPKSIYRIAAVRLLSTPVRKVGVFRVFLCGVCSPPFPSKEGPTSFPGLSYEDEVRDEKALVWAGHVTTQKWQYLTATRQGVARYSLMKYTSLRNK